jgi:prepilin-type N-terminal cleavage/methylation domain-containing protein
MKNPRLKRNSTDGFTLIELLVVIVMIGVLFSIALPSWVSFLNNRRVGSARDEILQTLRQTQAEAIRTRREKTVSFDTAASPPQITGFEGQSTPLGKGQFTAGMIGLRITPTTATSITFRSTGALLNMANPGDLPVTITVSAPANGNSRSCVIIETLLGSMRSVNKGDPGCS